MPRHSKSLPRGQLIESPMVCRAHVCYFPHLFIVADRQERMLWGVSYHWRILVTISRRPNTPIQTPIRQYLSQMRKQSLFFSLTSQITKNVCCRRPLHHWFIDIFSMRKPQQSHDHDHPPILKQITPGADCIHSSK